MAKAATSSYTVTAASFEAGYVATILVVLSSKVGLAGTASMAALAFTLPTETYLYVFLGCCGAFILLLLIALVDACSS